MKKRVSYRILSLFLVLTALLPAVGCASQLQSSLEVATVGAEVNTEEKKKPQKEVPKVFQFDPDLLVEGNVTDLTATEEDIALLESRYAGRTAYYGDIHSHPKAGNVADGKQTIAEWLQTIPEAGIDFVAFMCHKQVNHMYEPLWDSRIMIGGTEPSTVISDISALDKSAHYNILVRDPEDLIEIVSEIEAFRFTGGKNGVPLNEGTFGYPGFSKTEIVRLIREVEERGGLFVHVHPKQQMQSSKALDYWFRDYTGFEVIYSYHLGFEHTYSMGLDEVRANYKLWVELLSLKKRLWATAGSDSHQMARNEGITTVYATQKLDDAYMDQLAVGDFTAGHAGIRMILGDVNMGGHTDFEGKRLVFSVGDLFHKKDPTHHYTVRVYTEKGLIYKADVDPTETSYYALDADEGVEFYRVEIRDEDQPGQPIVALGQPIWND